MKKDKLVIIYTMYSNLFSSAQLKKKYNTNGKTPQMEII